MLAWLVPLFFFAVLMGSPVAGFLAFTVIGMVHAWQSWRQPHMANAFKWTREDSWLALCFMSIPLFKALSALWSEAPALAFQNAFWHAYYLFWPLVLLGLDRCQSDPRKVQIGLSLGLIVFGLHALFLEMSGDALHVPGVRANVGILAQLAMTAGIWSVIALTTPDTTFQWRCVHGAAALATGIVLVFSTRRLELMGFVALTGLVGLYRLRKQMTFWRALFLAVSAVAALAILIYLRKEWSI